MTKVYDRLAERPRTKIHIGNLNPEERHELRQIKVRGTPGLAQPNAPGKFTDVYYLAGDERAAAELFVEENRALLVQLDFSAKDVVQTSVSREIYDWILHALGKRTIEKYETVVLEERADGTQWLIDRDRFDTQPDRRYSTSERTSARLRETTVTDLYAEFETEITESMLREHPAVQGDPRRVLDYYRSAPAFACDPITIDSELAIRKRSG